MRKQSVRLFLFSSLAIFLLTLYWGFYSIPKQGELFMQEIQISLNQEIQSLTSSVRSATQALRYRLLDVLKAEGNDHATRTFQNSPFIAATLLEWDQNQWHVVWHSSKSKADFLVGEIQNLIGNWPLSQLPVDETYFYKVADLNGVAHFAMLAAVRRPNQIPMIGIGIFPANQFGLTLAADHAREIRVFDALGNALALSHPAYLGASLKQEHAVQEILTGDEISTEVHWQDNKGRKYLALASRIPESNLLASVETPLQEPVAYRVQSWLRLLIAAAGCCGLNWLLFSFFQAPLLMVQEEQEEAIDRLHGQLQRAQFAPVQDAELLKNPRLPHLDFVESEPVEEFVIHEEKKAEPLPPELLHQVHLGKVVQAALRGLESRLRESQIQVTCKGLDRVPITVDSLQLQTAIEEVLKNAIEAMSEGKEKKILIEATQEDGWTKLQIDDTGTGISPANSSKVFDPFFSTKDSEGVSRGLGLNVVRRVLEEMNGKIALLPLVEGTRALLTWPGHSSAGVSHSIAAQFNESSSQDHESHSLRELTSRVDGLPRIPIRKPKVRMLD